ncbi:hypothetical protein BURKHO8Y_210615 [Burkholderia sp. 8Y]|nr:hypothetical protein BURKHO8Y_210615 [Burkholderia sp. 8Y]
MTSHGTAYLKKRSLLFGVCALLSVGCVYVYWQEPLASLMHVIPIESGGRWESRLTILRQPCLTSGHSIGHKGVTAMHYFLPNGLPAVTEKGWNDPPSPDVCTVYLRDQHAWAIDWRDGTYHVMRDDKPDIDQ